MLQVCQKYLEWVWNFTGTQARLFAECGRSRNQVNKERLSRWWPRAWLKGSDHPHCMERKWEGPVRRTSRCEALRPGAIREGWEAQAGADGWCSTVIPFLLLPLPLSWVSLPLFCLNEPCNKSLLCSMLSMGQPQLCFKILPSGLRELENLEGWPLRHS